MIKPCPTCGTKVIPREKSDSEVFKQYPAHQTFILKKGKDVHVVYDSNILACYVNKHSKKSIEICVERRAQPLYVGRQ